MPTQAPPFRTGGQSSRWQDGDNQRDHGCPICAAHFQGPPTRPRWQKVECFCLKLVWSLPGSVLCIPANLAPLGPLLLLLKQHPIPVQTDTQRVSALHVQHTPHKLPTYLLLMGARSPFLYFFCSRHEAGQCTTPQARTSVATPTQHTPTLLKIRRSAPNTFAASSPFFAVSAALLAAALAEVAASRPANRHR